MPGRVPGEVAAGVLMGLLDIVLLGFSVYLVCDALGALPWLRGSDGEGGRPGLLRLLLAWSLGLLFFRSVLVPTINLVLGPAGELLRGLGR